MAAEHRRAPLAITIIDVIRRGHRVVLRVRGDLDLATAPPLREALLKAIGDSPAPAHIEVNLGAVNFIDVVAVGVLEQAAIAARQRAIKLELTHVSGEPLRVLAVTGSALQVRDHREPCR